MLPGGGLPGMLRQSVIPLMIAPRLATLLDIVDAAVRLDRSVNTVKTAARAIYAKLGVRGHAEAGARIRADLDC
jgi:hypothetical protein